MAERELKCGVCGNHFSSENLLKEHYRIEHPDKSFKSPEDSIFLDQIFPLIGKYTNKSTLIGFFLGIIVTMASVGTAFYVQDLMEDEVDVTVVTCGNCSYERFKTATDRMFNTDYQEVDYESQRGKQLIDKYELNYIPGFIYEKSVEEKENFSQVRNSLVKFEDAYVMSDQGEKIAQRFGEGFDLKDQE